MPDCIVFVSTFSFEVKFRDRGDLKRYDETKIPKRQLRESKEISGTGRRNVL